MKISSFRDWSVANWISLITGWAAVSGALFLHGFWGFFGIEFWNYIGFTEIVQTTFGIVILLPLLLFPILILVLIYGLLAYGIEKTFLKAFSRFKHRRREFIAGAIIT